MVDMGDAIGLLGTAIVLGATIKVIDNATEPMRTRRKKTKAIKREPLFSI